MIGLVLGAQTRLVLGAVLLLACLACVQQNGVADVFSKGSLFAPSTWENAATKLGSKAPEVPMVGSIEVLRPLASFASGVAGVLLLLSVFLPLRWLALVPIAAAVLIVLGPTLGVPAVGPLSPALTSLAAGVVLNLGTFVVVWKRRK
jgi:hypothetical protein